AALDAHGLHVHDHAPRETGGVGDVLVPEDVRRPVLVVDGSLHGRQLAANAPTTSRHQRSRCSLCASGVRPRRTTTRSSAGHTTMACPSYPEARTDPWSSPSTHQWAPYNAPSSESTDLGRRPWSTHPGGSSRRPSQTPSRK